MNLKALKKGPLEAHEGAAVVRTVLTAMARAYTGLLGPVPARGRCSRRGEHHHKLRSVSVLPENVDERICAVFSKEEISRWKKGLVTVVVLGWSGSHPMLNFLCRLCTAAP